MAADPIHIEAEDEVPAIIERVRRSSADEVHLVLPPQSRFGQSRFNFQLLKQYCTRLGKRVAIASADPVVQRLAEESGFGAIRLGTHPGAQPFAPQLLPQPSRGRFGSGPPLGAPAAAVGGPAGVAPAAAVQPASSQSRLGSIGRIVARADQPVARIRIGAPRRLPRQLTQFQPAKNVLYAGAGLLLLVGTFAALFSVPSARVTLTAQAQPFSTLVDITAEPGKPPAHVRPASITRSASAGGTATGVKTSGGQYAAGQFTYLNGCPDTLSVPNGQRLRAANGTVFAQIGDVPRIDRSQQQTVNVKAVQTGQAGNVGAGQITAIENNQFACLVGANQAPTGGGVDDQKQTVIQSSDLQNARQQIESQLRQQITDELGKGAQKGETLAKPPLFGIADFKTTHNVDENYPTFTATMTLTAEGDYYIADEVDQLFAGKLRAKVAANQQLTTNKVVTNYQVTSAAGGHLDFAGTASGFVAPKIDTERIRGQLVGKSAPQAHDLLSGLPVRHADIQQSPIPLPIMPLMSSRIYIDYGVDTMTPAPKSP
jgi:hypothetical protein